MCSCDTPQIRRGEAVKIESAGQLGLAVKAQSKGLLPLTLPQAPFRTLSHFSLGAQRELSIPSHPKEPSSQSKCMNPVLSLAELLMQPSVAWFFEPSIYQTKTP